MGVSAAKHKTKQQTHTDTHGLTGKRLDADVSQGHVLVETAGVKKAANMGVSARQT